MADRNSRPTNGYRMPEVQPSQASQAQSHGVSRDDHYVYSHNRFGRGCHYIGRFLSRPVSLVANSATRLFAHDRPGKSSPPSGRETQKRNIPLWARTTARVTAVMLFLLPALALGVLGFSLRMIANRFRNDISLIQSSVPPAIYHPERGLHLMTYNTGLMPSFIRNLNDLRSSQQRCREIARAITRNPDVTPDVVCFQEVFDQQATKQLCRDLSGHYHHIVHSVAPRETGLNSGLAIASKYPVQEVTFRPFSDLAGEDQLANKGLLRIVLDLGNDKTAVVYNTHLQAREGETYEAIRFAELCQIREWVEEDSHNDRQNNRHHHGIFLMGDLNSARSDEQGRVSKNPEYQHAMQALGKAFSNRYYDTHDPENDTRLVDRSESFFVNSDQATIRPEDRREPDGSWYLGAGNRQRQPWGSKSWKAHPEVARHCIYDYQMVYGDTEHRWAAHAEIRQLGLDVDNDLESGLSDHLPVSVIYREAGGFSAAIAGLEPEDFTALEVRELVKKLKLAYGHQTSDQISDNIVDPAFSGVSPLHKIAELRAQYQRKPVIVNELNRLEKMIRQSMNPASGTSGPNVG
ncbi:endonuclease/exonuclease/phosphatase family protein [Endozoicomonas sp. SCSIO W0465]|uniref:endonuclease/exonuclease/phosphatase family protein n=1 Tax=Endozoicomonas sp. SCSIO W0465 TaxID=2918516 RepID=UPI002075EDA7|nr:endonuclease/exonuclease/phosphatase family protein [Endozoicomonas sp. SCSIO W0465]USE36137.1 endonuclease/exonuclease/phosphatase family protein [Endozoicomonas sp. SCSIO W0465]